MIGSIRSSRSFWNSTTLPAALADEVLVVRLARHRLVALEALAEIVGADQPALHQHVERAVDGGGADARSRSP